MQFWMLKRMTRPTKNHNICWIPTKFRVRGKWLDVMSVQMFYRTTTLTFANRLNSLVRSFDNTPIPLGSSLPIGVINSLLVSDVAGRTLANNTTS